MKNVFQKGLLREARERAEREKELQANPLLQYSTTMLKAELRRRKSIK